MNITDIAREIARREGKKKQVNIAQIKEILGILSDLVYEEPGLVVLALTKNGARRERMRK